MIITKVIKNKLSSKLKMWNFREGTHPPVPPPGSAPVIYTYNWRDECVMIWFRLSYTYNSRQKHCKDWIWAVFPESIEDISHIPENEVGQIKTKLRNTCEKYCNDKFPNYQKIFINNLYKREDVIIMKQDKGSGVVIMDKTKYTEKCLALLSTK